MQVPRNVIGDAVTGRLIPQWRLRVAEFRLCNLASLERLDDITTMSDFLAVHRKQCSLQPSEEQAIA